MNTKTCSLPECDNPHEAKGYCNKHYIRSRAEKVLPRTCDFCKEEFNPPRRTSTVCGKEECLAKRKIRYNKKHNGRSYDLTCTACGVDYTSKRKAGKY